MNLSSTRFFPYKNFLSKLRLPLCFFTFFCIAYYGIALGTLPEYQFRFWWDPDGVLQILHPIKGSIGIDILTPGDIVLEIDGHLAVRRPFQYLFTPNQSAYRYKISRSGTIFTTEIPTAPITIERLIQRLSSVFAAILTWVVGSLIVLYATPDNGAAWLTGVVTIGMAVALAASEAALVGIPTSRLMSDAVMPFLTVGFVRLAYLPNTRPLSKFVRWCFFIALLMAGVLSLLALVEIFVLDHRASSIEQLIGISLYTVGLAWLGLGLLLNPIILVWRYLHIRPSYSRQQVLVLIVFTFLAVLPIVLLSITPAIFKYKIQDFWSISFLFLILIPGSYGYVIYRGKYLGLDIFVTRTLMTLFAGTLLIIVYSVVLGTSQRIKSFPFPIAEGVFSLTCVILVSSLAGESFRQGIFGVIYGLKVNYEDELAAVNRSLAKSPQFTTLSQVFNDLLRIHQVKKGNLLIADPHGQLISLASSGIDSQPETTSATQLQPVSFPPQRSHKTVEQSPDPAEILKYFPWATLAIPMVINQSIVGVLVLGAPVPDGIFNAREIQFLHKVADSLAIATEASRLFEASQTMSRSLIKIREKERNQLAAQLHDDPLQRILMVANELDRYSSDHTVDEYRNYLGHYKQELISVARHLRTICAGLRPPGLSQGIQYAIREIIFETQKNTKLQIHFEIDLNGDDWIHDEGENAAYYICHESLNNIKKHAQATEVWINLILSNSTLRLEIHDNGIGVSAKTENLADLLRSHHFGLAGMFEWARLAGGALIVKKREISGTSVLLTIQNPMDISKEIF